MKLPAIRRNKCDLLKMIKMVHKRNTWGKRYIYATNDNHDIYIEIERLDFRKGIIYFRVSFPTLYDTYFETREIEVKYHMGKTDDGIKKLERRINKSIINELECCLELEVGTVVAVSNEYVALIEKQNNARRLYRKNAEEQYCSDENKDVIVEALLDEYTRRFLAEKMCLKGKLIAENKENYRKELHKRYIEMLKNEDD